MSLEVRQSKKDRRQNKGELQQTDYSGVYMKNEKLDQKLNRYKSKLVVDKRRSRLLIETDMTHLKREVDNFNIMIESSVSFQSLSRPATTTYSRKLSRSVPTLPDINRDPTTFPAEWFTSVYVPSDKELMKIRRRSSHPPLPATRRSKTAVDKAKPKGIERSVDSEEKPESRASSSPTKFLQRSKTEDLTKITSFTTGNNELTLKESRWKDDKPKNLDFESETKDGNVSEMKLPLIQDLPTEDVFDDDADKQEAMPVSRSVRELKEMTLIDNLANKAPDKRDIRKQKILRHNQRKTDKIISKMRTFLVDLEEEFRKNEEVKSNLDDLLFYEP